MSAVEGARSANAVTRFLRPRSIAVIGISTRTGSAGQIILQCLKTNGFAGEVHLVGRTDEMIDGRRVLKSADELPEGVDLAVFTLPAAAVREPMQACARRKVGAALVFAAGFAETGDQAMQDAVAATARAAGLAVIGPNSGCLSASGLPLANNSVLSITSLTNSANAASHSSSTALTNSGAVDWFFGQRIPDHRAIHRYTEDGRAVSGATARVPKVVS